MAKAGKLTKLRSALKKINSFSKTRPENTTTNISPPSHSHNYHLPNTSESQTVYVGKSLRPYEVNSHLLNHPVIQELVERSSDYCDDDTVTVIGCEVVLFEHLLWMLENSDGRTESLDDLVQFYAY